MFDAFNLRSARGIGGQSVRPAHIVQLSFADLVAERREWLLAGDAHIPQAVALHEGQESLDDRGMDVRVVVSRDEGDHQTVIERPLDLRADFPLQMFAFDGARIEQPEEIGDRMEPSAPLQQRGHLVGLGERIFLHQIDLQTDGKRAFQTPLCSRIAVASVRPDRSTGDDPELEALEDAVGARSVAAQIVGVDDEAHREMGDIGEGRETGEVSPDGRVVCDLRSRQKYHFLTDVRYRNLFTD